MKLILLAILLALAPPALADQILPAPQIDSSGNVKYRGGPTIGRMVDGIYVPIAPTQPATDNSTRAASTAFVQGAVASRLQATPDQTTAWEGLDNSVGLTPLSGAWQGRKLRSNTGRQSFGGNTGAATLAGGGATEYVSTAGKSTTSGDPVQVIGSAGLFDRFYVKSGTAPGAGQTITATLQINGADTTHKLTLSGASQASTATDLFTVPIQSGQAISVKVETTSGVASGHTFSWGVGFVPAPLDQPFFYGFRVQPTLVTINKPGSPAFYTEAPMFPVSVPGQSKKVFLAPTDFAVLAQTDDALTADTITVSSASIVTQKDLTKPWARSYNGALSAVTVNPSLSSQRIYFVSHAENKNEIPGTGALSGRTPQPGTVGNFPITVADPNTWSGYDEAGNYHEGYTAYFQFTTLSYVDSNSGNGYGLTTLATDLGPIVWPTGGYLNPDGSRAGGAVGQPTAYSDGTYVYVYYRDDSAANDGMMVARALISDLQSASDADKPKQFRTWCGPTLGWLPSLPAGFDKANITAFWKTRGPPAVPVAMKHNYRGRLAVAKVRGQSYYLAVGQYSPDGVNWRVVLYKTADLVNFDEIDVLAHGNAYNYNFLNYPILMGSDGDTNIIDLNDFNVIGSSFTPNVPVYKQHILYGQFVTP